MKKLLSIMSVFVLLMTFSAGCNDLPIEFNEQGVTLFKCLEYGDAKWREIEDRFIEDVLSNIPYEYKIYDSSELSGKILENRNGMVIVERCIGFVTNKITGDGRVLNTYDKDYDYISYRSVTGQKYHDGTVFISYMIYNPDNNYIDDIVGRYDFILCREYED